MKLFVLIIFLFVGNLYFCFAQSYDLNKDGVVNSSDVVLLYNHIFNGTEKELSKDDFVGTWKIVFNEYTRYENDILTDYEKENVEEENNFYVVRADNKVLFLEYSGDSNSWHEDGTFIYSIYNGNFYLLGGDFKSFKILSRQDDKMVIESSFEEDKSYTVVLKKNVDTLVRVSKDTNLIPYQ